MVVHTKWFVLALRNDTGVVPYGKVCAYPTERHRGRSLRMVSYGKIVQNQRRTNGRPYEWFVLILA
jgi:hypothetical protein